MELVRTRKYTLLLLMTLATFCLLRAVTVMAMDVEDMEEGFEEEVYDSEPQDGMKIMKNRGRSIASDTPSGMRYVRPEEANQRKITMMGEDEYEQVEGAEHLQAVRRGPASAIPVPAVPAPMQTVQKKTLESQPMELPATAEKRATAEVMAPQRRSAPSPIAVREQYAGLTTQAPSLQEQKAEDAVASEDTRLSLARARGVQEVSVIAADSGYYPARVFVTQGIPVKVYLSTVGKQTQCFMIDDLEVKKGVAPGHVEEISFVPEMPGDYRFHCPVGSIEGKITVRAPASAPVTE